MLPRCDGVLRLSLAVSLNSSISLNKIIFSFHKLHALMCYKSLWMCLGVA